MPGKRFALVLLLFCETAFSQHLYFTGDILLSRNVAKEIEYTHTSPWKQISPLFIKDSIVIGNFENAIGSEILCADKVTEHNPCFAVQYQYLKYLQDIPFSALSLENNHAMDLGPKAFQQTKDILQKLNIATLTLKDSPKFLTVNGVIIGIVSYSEIPGKNILKPTYSDLELSQKIRLAKALANLVIVYVHWGHELWDWPTSDQHEKAKWLIQQGADIIIGHHPHVIQKAECIFGKPVLFSLGNHIFDQKYPMTKEGSVIDCNPSLHQLSCKAYLVKTPLNTSFPISYQKDKKNYKALQNCAPIPHQLLQLQNYTFKPHIEPLHDSTSLHVELWTHQQRKFIFPASTLLTLFSANFNPKEQPFLLTLQKQYSPIDQEHAPRPYVYSIGEHGLIAKWRGSALAWPLLDFTLVSKGGVDYLCALHRGDSFLNINPNTPKRRTQVYQWNGFGFSGIDDLQLAKICIFYYRHFLNSDNISHKIARVNG